MSLKWLPRAREELHSIASFSISPQSSTAPSDSPPSTSPRLKTKRYNTEQVLQNIPPEKATSPSRELSNSAPDLHHLDAPGTGHGASPLISCRYSVAAQASAEVLFDEDYVEEPAADVEMHIPTHGNKKGKGRGKKEVVEQLEVAEGSSSSLASENVDQSEQQNPGPST